MKEIVFYRIGFAFCLASFAYLPGYIFGQIVFCDRGIICNTQTMSFSHLAGIISAVLAARFALKLTKKTSSTDGSLNLGLIFLGVFFLGGSIYDARFSIFYRLKNANILTYANYITSFLYWSLEYKKHFIAPTLRRGNDTAPAEWIGTLEHHKLCSHAGAWEQWNPRFKSQK
jgi:hypothetical protein